ncbi:prealbumin-like fold domain-containing protein, partial [Bacillus cereus]
IKANNQLYATLKVDSNEFNKLTNNYNENKIDFYKEANIKIKQVSASNLRPGDYQFVETKAPKDYDLNKTPIPFTIEKSQPTHVS